jgi:hypothetical protein
MMGKKIQQKSSRKNNFKDEDDVLWVLLGIHINN